MNFNGNNVLEVPKKSNKKLKYIPILMLFTVASLLTACNTSSSQSKEEVNKAKQECKKWEKSKEDGSEKCVDTSSSHHGMFIWAGGLYPNKGSYESAKTTQQTKAKTAKSKTTKSDQITKKGGFKSGLGSGGVKGGG